MEVLVSELNYIRFMWDKRNFRGRWFQDVRNGQSLRGISYLRNSSVNNEMENWSVYIHIISKRKPDWTEEEVLLLVELIEERSQ